MYLKSQTICPTEVRARLVKNLSSQDNAVCDMKLALEAAEDQCFELAKKNDELEKQITLAKDVICELNDEK